MKADPDKVVILADLHIHDWSEFSVTTPAGNSRLLDCVNVLHEVRLYCAEHNINRVIIAGDLMHRPGILPTVPFNMLCAELAALKGFGITVEAMPGNHDMAGKSGESHMLLSLHAAELLDCLTGRESGWGVSTFNDRDVVFFAYCDSRELLHKRMVEAPSAYSDRPLAVFHHGFKGARVGSTVEHVVKEHIDPKSLADFGYAAVVSGHYHAWQLIGGNPDWMYIGAPLEFTRSDRREGDLGRGFRVYDFSTNTSELVELKRPRFVTIKESDLDVSASTPLKGVPGNFVDVIMDTHSDVDVVVSTLREMGAAGVKPIPVPRSVSVAVRMPVQPGLVPVDVLKLYVAHKAAELEGEDAELVLNLGRSLLAEAEEAL